MLFKYIFWFTHFRLDLKLECPTNLRKLITVFQEEIFAIIPCVRLMKKQQLAREIIENVNDYSPASLKLLEFIVKLYGTYVDKVEVTNSTSLDSQTH